MTSVYICRLSVLHVLVKAVDYKSNYHTIEFVKQRPMQAALLSLSSNESLPMNASCHRRYRLASDSL
jgi:hypothetical protein